ncbi:hypothetical protein [Streptomyces sp. SLBN-8D4]|jgi:hypothetical protein|uniref:hypothetical protein n=1 Tax=Streptomyces sp. SLBN-8D4 TaxID=3377728 RepID=UPI003C7D9550
MPGEMPLGHEYRVNSNLTASSVSLAAKAAILSNSSTDIWDDCTARSAITVMVHPSQAVANVASSGRTARLFTL